MNLAIMILCHKNPNQIYRLIDSLSSNCIDFFIHIDKKSDIIIDRYKSNIFYIPNEKRINVKWATFSQIQAELNLLKFAYDNDKKYDYYWLVSGQDYPIVSTDKILSELSIDTSINYMNIVNSRNYGLDHNSGYDKRNEICYPDWILKRDYTHRLLRHMWIKLTGGPTYTFSFFKRKESIKYKYYYGSQWWCINRKFVEYVFEYINNNPEYLLAYNKSCCSDESFFQTLLMNSEYKNSRKDYLHYIDWNNNNSNSPKTLTVNDLSKIIHSGKLIARKLDILVDETLFNELDKRRK